MDLERFMGDMDFTFSTKLPFSKTTVNGRQYNIDSEVDILKVLKEDDKKLVYTNILRLLERHYNIDPVKLYALPLVDIQWMIKELKSQSDSNILDGLIVKCGHCGAKQEIKIDLNKITPLNIDNYSKTVILKSKKDEEVAIVFKHKSIMSYIDNVLTPTIEDDKLSQEDSDAISMRNLLVESIDAISDKNGTADLTVYSKELLTKLIGKIPRKQKKEVAKFIYDIPRLVYTEEIVCDNADCGKKITPEFNDFFLFLF